MALTVTSGNQAGSAASLATFAKSVRALCDDSYPDGGYDLGLFDYVPPGASLASLEPIFTGPPAEVTYKPYWDTVNGKLHVLAADTGLEVAEETDLTDIEFHFLLITH